MRSEPGWGLLDDRQAAASAKLLADESAARDHVVVSLSGAHAYGFPSADSDVDVKAIHVTPTARLVGLASEPSAASRTEWIDGVEVDYTSNEIGPVLAGVLKGNGNYIERVLGHAPLARTALLDGLGPVVARALSRRVHHHYRGFATSQLHAFDESPTIKKLLYVLRTALTGAHLLATGRLVIDVTELLDAYGFGDARPLVDAKRAGERLEMAPTQRASWRERAENAIVRLDEAQPTSPLPEAATNAEEVEAWLLSVRRERLGR